MLKTIMAAAAVSTLALTTALAQTSTPPAGSTPSTSTPPAATSTPATPAPSASNTSAAGKAHFVTKQTQDQWLATKFKGTDVIGTDDKKIGDVSDMLFDKDHKIIAYIVGVGGFLGIGQKDVAIDPASFQMVPASATRSSSTTSGSSTGSNTGSSGTANSSSNDHDNFKLRLSMSKDELKAAPAFEQYNARPATTSQAPANRPAGGPATAPAPKQ
jgi:PRC-barrel domain